MSEDLRTSEAIRAAFDRMRPQRDASAAKEPRRLTTPEELEELRRFGTFVRDAVTALLGTEVADAPRPFAAWSPEQRTLLEEIARTPYELHLNAGDLGRILERRGAIGQGGSHDDRYLARYVGLREPSALETEVAGRPRWLWLRLHLMGTVSDQDWLGAMNGASSVECVDLARRALDNAYQLMRRWPLPTITTAIEREDAAILQHALLPILAAIATGDLTAELDRELAQGIVVPEYIVVMCLVLARRGVLPPDRIGDRLTDALQLQTSVVIGRDLLALLPPEHRVALVEPMRLKPYNLDGWPYVDLLEPLARAKLITVALEGFKQACNREVAARVTELIQGLDSGAHDALRAVAATKAPNAKLIAEALADRQ